MGRNGENIRTMPDQQNIFLADMAGQHAVFRKGCQRNALDEIGA
jgi:hypothetical protein